MKILLNGLPVVYPISGVGQYTLQLGKALEALLGSENVFWFGKNLSGEMQDSFGHKDPTFINRLQHRLRGGVRGAPGLKALVHLWRHRQFRACAQRAKPSIYHETNYAPFHFEEGPTLITLFDLSFVRHPEWHPAERVRFLEKHCLKRLGRVEAIITISEYSRKEIVSLTGVNPDKIFVTPLGVDRSFSPEGNRMRGLPDPYILYVGNLEPRKNLPMLLTAFQSLPRRLKERYSLVIAGAEGWHADGLRKALRPLQKDGKVILTGYVPQSLLSDLYRGASLFVYPSYYEGFGLPVLEAMACGVPVISSDSSSLPEVVGDAAILVDPFLAGEWSETMARVLSDENLQKEIGQRGLNQARMFTWERCAGETVRIYQRVLGERR